jgi:nicotinamidase-related amidase
LAGTAGALAGIAPTGHSGAQAEGKKPAGLPAVDLNRILRLDGEYYRHYPVDFSLGKEGARGFQGWGESTEIDAPAEETALVLMHLWNVGMTPELAWKPDGPSGGVMLMAEWAARTVPVIRNDIPPLLSAARGAKLPVIHVAASEMYAKKYPGYRTALNISGPEPSPLPRAPRADETKSPDDRKDALLFGPQFPKSFDYYWSHIDFPEEAKPLDSEPVTVTTHQLNSVLRNLGVWQLIYCGFAINWCLWFSPGGMCDMSRLGYRCSCIREGVAAVENKASTRGEFNKEQALWRTSLMFGYIHNARNFIRACASLGPKRG